MNHRKSFKWENPVWQMNEKAYSYHIGIDMAQLNIFECSTQNKIDRQYLKVQGVCLVQWFSSSVIFSNPIQLSRGSSWKWKTKSEEFRLHFMIVRNYVTSGLKAQKHTAYGNALCIKKLAYSPCKGKSTNNKYFCPFRAKLPTSIFLGRCPRLWAFAPSGRYRGDCR